MNKLVLRCWLIIGLTLSLKTVGLWAQSTPPPTAATAPAAVPTSPPTASATGDSIMSMSQFVVNTTAGMGYVDANSVSGFKTNQPLLDIPQAELVVTQDFIKDVPFSKNLGDLLQYVGINSFYRNAGFGEGTMVRGSRISVGLTDGMIGPGWVDSDFIDSFEILKGTSAALYQGTGTTGALLKTTKKPLPNEQNDVEVTFDSQGLVRGTVDSTGPIGKLDGVKVSYRVVAGAQDGGQYFVNDNLRIGDVHPSVQFDFAKASLMVALDWSMRIIMPR